jgi:archaellum component FlaF (FlaF/FlaG flagellin family)
MTKQRKIIIISLLAMVLFIIASYIVYLSIPTTFVKFETAPQQVMVSIDNKGKQAVNNGSTVAVSPGQHNITITQDGFDSYKKTILVGNHSTYDFLVALTATTDSAKNKLLNPTSEAIVERIFDAKMAQQTETLNEKYPILKILPIYARLYEISACPSVKYPKDPTKIALCVGETEAYLKPYVLKDIRSRGYNPDDYEIIWQVDTPQTQ